MNTMSLHDQNPSVHAVFRKSFGFRQEQLGGHECAARRLIFHAQFSGFCSEPPGGDELPLDNAMLFWVVLMCYEIWRSDWEFDSPIETIMEKDLDTHRFRERRFCQVLVRRLATLDWPLGDDEVQTLFGEFKWWEMRERSVGTLNHVVALDYQECNLDLTRAIGPLGKSLHRVAPGAWRHGVFYQAINPAIVGLSELGAWRRGCPAKRSVQVRRVGLQAVRRGGTMRGQVRVSIINPESGANYLCVIKVEKPWGLSSPFLFVLGNDRVILYTGADDDTSGVVDA
ncbi:hypothetical protein DEO72_LG2g4366 [Vigna unguiculata]|uniref:Uncharacterized protein n=1 Tax=Vigna unguiculata TaxID=3917 RepID=A0A4D6L6B5_VIGUN|nr:hypothetical protein DEO72_LG2g4366 [Vigna unguiculata]